MRFPTYFFTTKVFISEFSLPRQKQNISQYCPKLSQERFSFKRMNIWMRTSLMMMMTMTAVVVTDGKLAAPAS